MNKMLLKMADGGIVYYTDDCESYPGCPTCDYGSEYINEIHIMLTSYKVHVKVNQMYEYVLSEGQMMRLFLSEYENIQAMTEKEFIDWFKEKLHELVNDSDWSDSRIEKFDVIEIGE